jgi:hypothetical protein
MNAVVDLLDAGRVSAFPLYRRPCYCRSRALCITCARWLVIWRGVRQRSATTTSRGRRAA